MKILVVGDPHGALEKIKKIPTKNADLILITGDLGKADLARKKAFENVEREKKGLPELEDNANFSKKVWKEIYDSTLSVLKYLSKFAPVYTLLGNVGTSTDAEMKKEEEKMGIKLPYLRLSMSKVKNVNLVRNVVRNINGLRVGFLEYFTDACWVREFKPGDYKKTLKKAKKETDKAKKILKWFDKLDILLCHQPPYGILDKMMNKRGPKHWYGKHAGSKIILDYIKRKQPRYVFCGHIHEGKGKKKFGKTSVINAGVSGDYFIIDVPSQ